MEENRDYEVETYEFREIGTTGIRFGAKLILPRELNCPLRGMEYWGRTEKEARDEASKAFIDWEKEDD